MSKNVKPDPRTNRGSPDAVARAAKREDAELSDDALEQISGGSPFKPVKHAGNSSI